MTTVKKATMRQNAMERVTTAHSSGVVDQGGSSRARPTRRLPELLAGPELLEAGDDLPEDRVSQWRAAG